MRDFILGAQSFTAWGSGPTHTHKFRGMVAHEEGDSSVQPRFHKVAPVEPAPVEAAEVDDEDGSPPPPRWTATTTLALVAIVLGLALFSVAATGAEARSTLALQPMPPPQQPLPPPPLPLPCSPSLAPAVQPHRADPPPPHCPELASRTSLASLSAFAPVRCYMLDGSHPAVAAQYLRCAGAKNGTCVTCASFYWPVALSPQVVRLCYLDGDNQCRAAPRQRCDSALNVSTWPAPPPPPLPPLPPPPTTPLSRLADINARYFSGRPSNDLIEAGVLVHLDDGMTTDGAPWTPCLTGWCAAIGSDHQSCSLINQGVPHLYSKHAPWYGFGLVLSSDVLQRHRQGGILCSYAQDGGTWGPDAGCHGDAPAGDPHCDPDSPPWLCHCTLERWWGCVFPPGALDQMMRVQLQRNRQGYNEVVVNSTFWRLQLPGIVEAFVDFGGGAAEARSAHGRFHRHYQGRLGGKEVPLLNWAAPVGFAYLDAPPSAPASPPSPSAPSLKSSPPSAPPWPPPALPPRLPPLSPLPPRSPPQPHLKCRAHCPPTDIEVLPALEVRASEENAAMPSSSCVDGSRTTWCMPGPAGRAWLSVRLPAGHSVHSVALYVFYTWDRSYTLAPYEVWAGDDFGVPLIRCNGTLATSLHLPTPNGLPAVLPCGGVRTERMPYITVRQVVDESKSPWEQPWMQLSEMIVYAPSPPHGVHLAAGPMATPGEVAAAVSARFEAGAPTDDVAAAGVLVHMIDGYEQAGRPWELCRTNCTTPPSDHWSVSLINAAKPTLFTMPPVWGGAFLVDSTVPFLCAFPSDYGIGSKPNAGCDSPPRFTLKQAMEAQPLSNYNDIAIGWLDWEANLPWAIEAFMVIGGEDTTALERMRRMHRSFLQRYQLTAEEVPLLLMASICQRPCWLPWDMSCHRPNGTQCFTDISGTGGSLTAMVRPPQKPGED